MTQDDTELEALLRRVVSDYYGNQGQGGATPQNPTPGQPNQAYSAAVQQQGQQGQAGGGGQDPWLQMQQQALNSANLQWGQLQSPGASPYQADPGDVPQQLPGGGYASGEDWVKNQAAAQAHSDATYGKAPGINYMGQTGPYGAVGDLAANQYVARADQWAMNGSGPAIAPAIQQAINEDPRLSDLYSTLPIQRINNVGNGFGALPGALTPGVALHNGGQIPAAYNDLLKYSASNPGKPQGMDNLGPVVAQYMANNPVMNKGLDVMGRPLTTAQSFYDYSGPNGSPANSAGGQQATAQRQSALNSNPQLQMLARLLMGNQPATASQPASFGGPGASMRSSPTPSAPAAFAPQEMAPGQSPDPLGTKLRQLQSSAAQPAGTNVTILRFSR